MAAANMETLIVLPNLNKIKKKIKTIQIKSNFFFMACDKDCCVCGNWFAESDVQSLERDLVHLDVQKRYLNSTLNEVYLCRRCMGSCDGCMKRIPAVQNQKHGMCFKCEEVKKNQKKAPSRR